MTGGDGARTDECHDTLSGLAEDIVTKHRSCNQCRQTRKSQRSFEGGPREMHPAVCAQCGVDTMVPFRPRGDRPVYCSDCFSSMRESNYR